jgi:hypothetical protein
MTKLDQVIERLRALPPEEAEALAYEIEVWIDRPVPAWQLEELRRRQAAPLELAPEEEMDAFFACHRE